MLLDSLQTLGKYATHLADLYSNHALEARSVIMYYIEFITELLVQLAMLFYFVFIMVPPCFLLLPAGSLSDLAFFSFESLPMA